MEIGYQVGQVVLRDTVTLQQQWQEPVDGATKLGIMLQP